MAVLPSGVTHLELTQARVPMVMSRRFRGFMLPRVSAVLVEVIVLLSFIHTTHTRKGTILSKDDCVR